MEQFDSNYRATSNPSASYVRILHRINYDYAADDLVDDYDEHKEEKSMIMFKKIMKMITAMVIFKCGEYNTVNE